MQPHLVRWDRAYRERGLEIVYVADGRRVTPERVLDVMKADGASFRVVHDSTGGTAQAYGVTAFPTAYVLDRSGVVVWEGIPHFNLPATERAITSALDSP